MKTYGCKLSFFLGVLALVGLFGCKQESPAGKATEAAGQAAVDAIKTPIDKARGVEKVRWRRLQNRRLTKSRKQRSDGLLMIHA